MRVLIDISYAERGPSGTAVYIEQLIAALRERGVVEVVEARQGRRLKPGRAEAVWRPHRSALNLLFDLHWLLFGLPRRAREAGADVVHHPLPAFSARMGVPQVTTFHDLAFLRLPDMYDPAYARLAARQARTAARKSAALVCVSEATASDASVLLGAPRWRTVVARHGPGQATGEGPLDRPAADGHLLFVGDTEPRKNLTGLLAAYSEYRLRTGQPADLVLAGAAAAAAGEPGVRGVAAPGREELIALLRGARALVHPSVHEGFGLTLLEAMALGVPVLAVRNAGTEELCGDAALLVAPDGMAEALVAAAGDAALLADLSARGAARAAAFSWEESAESHERAYTLAAGTTEPSNP